MDNLNLMKQTLLHSYEVIQLANKHSAKSLSDPTKASVYTEQFVAAIEEALLVAQSKSRKNAPPLFVCDCGSRGPHICSLPGRQT